MKKKLQIVAFLAIGMQYLFAQDSVQYRIILIGDAGEINAAQKVIFSDAVNRSLPGKTLALFLGDNIYPTGMEFDSAKQKISEGILKSQYEGLRNAEVPVYFIPGNHDWDKSGPDGYQKLIAANTFLKAQQDSIQGVGGGLYFSPASLFVFQVVAGKSEEGWYPYFTAGFRF